MADYFTKASIAFTVTPVEGQQLEAALTMDGDQTTTLDYPECLVPIWATVADFARAITGEPADDWFQFGVEEFAHEPENGSFWLYGTNVNVDAVTKIIQTICQPEKPIVMEWCSDCSSPRTDGYGGGVAVIFADKIIFENTASMAARIVKEHS